MTVSFSLGNPWARQNSRTAAELTTIRSVRFANRRSMANSRSDFHVSMVRSVATIARIPTERAAIRP
jgi:hypothetical protein